MLGKGAEKRFTRLILAALALAAAALAAARAARVLRARWEIPARDNTVAS